ncbi:phage baseplate protein [Shinella kummerowiae]|uniref:phage baseplate protein n=1 Tax=Shinella kummerowiae TaxID=417745 RepID=UPI0021B6AEFC|nr:phage baseplate protein [Shinella kummerowiae]MCT7668177.1 phage baseplate protein [Shinella kummerowiae]
MASRDARAIAREFQRLHKLSDDLDRRMASMMLSGQVAEIDGDRVRLEILPEDSRTGKPFLSPWVQVQEAAGQTGTHFPVKKGDPMRLMSPNGELGPQSLAVRDGYTADAANPSEQKQKQLVIGNDGPVLIKGSAIVFEASGTVNVKSAGLTHNDVNVGETHKHTDVLPGGGLSGPPA